MATLTSSPPGSSANSSVSSFPPTPPTPIHQRQSTQSLGDICARLNLPRSSPILVNRSSDTRFDQLRSIFFDFFCSNTDRLKKKKNRDVRLTSCRIRELLFQNPSIATELFGLPPDPDGYAHITDTRRLLLEDAEEEEEEGEREIEIAIDYPLSSPSPSPHAHAHESDFELSFVDFLIDVVLQDLAAAGDGGDGGGGDDALGEIVSFFRLLDTENSGRVSWVEFVRGVGLLGEVPNPDLERYFTRRRRDQKGKGNEGAAAAGGNVEDEEAELLEADMRVDGNEGIFLHEFVDLFMTRNVIL